MRESKLLERADLHVPALVAKGDAVGACGAGLHVLGVHGRSGVRVLLRHADVAVAFFLPFKVSP